MTFQDDLNRSQAARARWKRAKLFFAFVCLVVIVGIGWVAASHKTTNIADSANGQGLTAPTYKYGYLRDTCQKGLDQYGQITSDLNLRLSKIEGLEKNKEYMSDVINIISLVNVLDGDKAVWDEIAPRMKRLQSCVNSVAAKKDFSSAELADLDAITKDYPKATGQPNSVNSISTKTPQSGKVFIPAYTYTPYIYAFDPGNPMPTTSASNAGQSSTTDAPQVTCDQAQKSYIDQQYSNDLSSLGSRQDSERTAIANRIAAAGLGTSGIGAQQMDAAMATFRQQRASLDGNYHQQLANIHC